MRRPLGIVSNKIALAKFPALEAGNIIIEFYKFDGVDLITKFDQAHTWLKVPEH